jgi:hypothetical protein
MTALRRRCPTCCQSRPVLARGVFRAHPGLGAYATRCPGSGEPVPTPPTRPAGPRPPLRRWHAEVLAGGRQRAFDLPVRGGEPAVRARLAHLLGHHRDYQVLAIDPADLDQGATAA